MAGFSFQKKQRKVATVNIEGKEYDINVSPSNYDFVKRVSQLVKDFADMSTRIKSEGVDGMGGIGAVLDAIVARQREIVELLFPGKWDEFFAAAGQDISAMTELLVYVVDEVKRAAVSAQVDAAQPEIKGNGESV